MRNVASINLRNERLLLLAFAMAFLALAGFTGFMAWTSLGEAERCLTAAALPDHPIDGSFYVVRGNAESPLLAPKDYPEIKDALEYMVIEERRPNESAPWQPIPGRTATGATVEELRLGGINVIVGRSARILVERTQSYRDVDRSQRLALAQRSGLGELAACGIWQSDRLTSSRFQRLIIASGALYAPTLAEADRVGGTKAKIFGVFALVLAAAAGLTIYLAMRGASR